LIVTQSGYGEFEMRSFGFILLAGLALTLVSCSDRLKPGTEGTLDEHGATELSAHFLLYGSGDHHVAAGTKVRVVKDESPQDDKYRKVKVLVLEGNHKNENAEVTREYIER
jgi:hypothetical protein